MDLRPRYDFESKTYVLTADGIPEGAEISIKLPGSDRPALLAMCADGVQVKEGSWDGISTWAGAPKILVESP